MLNHDHTQNLSFVIHARSRFTFSVNRIACLCLYMATQELTKENLVGMTTIHKHDTKL